MTIHMLLQQKGCGGRLMIFVICTGLKVKFRNILRHTGYNMYANIWMKIFPLNIDKIIFDNFSHYSILKFEQEVKNYIIYYYTKMNDMFIHM